MSRLRMMQVWMATVVLGIGVAFVPGVTADSTQTFTGKVSDSMCEANHSEGNLAPAVCVRACVQKGANYALVVGDKVYTLNTSDKETLDELNKLAAIRTLAPSIRTDVARKSFPNRNHLFQTLSNCEQGVNVPQS